MGKTDEVNENNTETSLEELFGQIEGIIEKLEDPDVSIEDAFKDYESGMKILKECNDKLDKIEKKVLEIGPDGELNEF